MHRALPVQVRQWIALSMGNRNHRRVRVKIVQRNQVRNIKATMEGAYVNVLLTRADGKVQVIGMEVDEIEFIFSLQDLFEQNEVMRHLINAISGEAERLRAARYQFRRSHGIA